MKSRSAIVSAMLLILSLTGCGEPPPPPMAKDKYEKLALEFYQMTKKPGDQVAAAEKLFKKHGVTRVDYEKCIEVFGDPDAVKKERQTFINKMTIGIKNPPPRSGQ